MTERLYYGDARLLNFEARVVERGDDGRSVYLDRTAFYPTSGGQPHDTGVLGGARVVDVVDDGERIRHVLESPLPAADVVLGTVDAERRFDHMQQHTGQHLLSALFEERFGHATVSVHFGGDYSTLDLATEQLSADQRATVERQANDIVAEARRVAAAMEDSATVTGLRKPTDRTGPIRVVSIDGIDRSACGGTHVSSTAEIGAVLLRSTERIRKTTRVEFVCGHRAIRAAHADFARLSAVANSLSAAPEDVVALVESQLGAAKEAEQRVRRLERELAAFRARELYDRTTPHASGRRVIVVDSAPAMDDLKTLAQALIAMTNVAVIGVIDQPPSVMVATSADCAIDSGQILREALQSVGGRGGGSPRMAQGSMPTAGGSKDVIAALRSALA